MEAKEKYEKCSEDTPDKDTLKVEMDNAKKALDGATEDVVKAQQEQLREKEAFQAIESTYNRAQTDLATVKSSIYGQTTSAQSAVASAQGGVASAEAQLDAAKDARQGASLNQLEQGVGTANRAVDSAEVQKDVAKASWMRQNSLRKQQNSSRKQLRMQLSSRSKACRTAWLEASWQQRATAHRKLRSRKCRTYWRMRVSQLRFPVLSPQFMQRWENREMVCSLW